MRAYTVCDCDNEGAVLVFASNAKRAKKIGYPCIQDWYDSTWIDVSVNWFKSPPGIIKQLDTGKEQCIDSPPSCKLCFRWGEELVNGICLSCKYIEKV